MNAKEYRVSCFHRKKIMELERQSRSSANSEHLNNGRAPSPWSDDSRQLSPQSSDMSSDQLIEPKIDPLSEPIPEDHDGLVEEVKHLRVQLQTVNERWSHDRHTALQVCYISKSLSILELYMIICLYYHVPTLSIFFLVWIVIDIVRDTLATNPTAFLFFSLYEINQFHWIE